MVNVRRCHESGPEPVDTPELLSSDTDSDERRTSKGKGKQIAESSAASGSRPAPAMVKAEDNVASRPIFVNGARLFRGAEDLRALGLTLPNNTTVDMRLPSRQRPGEIWYRIHPKYFTQILKGDHDEWLRLNGLYEFSRLPWIEDGLESVHMLEFVRSYNRSTKSCTWRGMRVEFDANFARDVFKLREDGTPPRPPAEWMPSSFADKTARGSFTLTQTDRVTKERLEFALVSLSCLPVRSAAHKPLVYLVEETTNRPRGWNSLFLTKLKALFLVSSRDQTVYYIHIRLGPFLGIIFEAKQWIVQVPLQIAHLEMLSPVEASRKRRKVSQGTSNRAQVPVAVSASTTSEQAPLAVSVAVSAGVPASTSSEQAPGAVLDAVSHGAPASKSNEDEAVVRRLADIDEGMAQAIEYVASLSLEKKALIKSVATIWSAEAINDIQDPATPTTMQEVVDTLEATKDIRDPTPATTMEDVEDTPEATKDIRDQPPATTMQDVVGEATKDIQDPAAPITMQDEAMMKVEANVKDVVEVEITEDLNDAAGDVTHDSEGSDENSDSDSVGILSDDDQNTMVDKQTDYRQRVLKRKAEAVQSSHDAEASPREAREEETTEPETVSLIPSNEVELPEAKLSQEDWDIMIADFSGSCSISLPEGLDLNFGLGLEPDTSLHLYQQEGQGSTQDAERLISHQRGIIANALVRVKALRTQLAQRCREKEAAMLRIEELTGKLSTQEPLLNDRDELIAHHAAQVYQVSQSRDCLKVELRAAMRETKDFKLTNSKQEEKILRLESQISRIKFQQDRRTQALAEIQRRLDCLSPVDRKRLGLEIDMYHGFEDENDAAASRGTGP